MRNRAFTLIELLVVVAIIALLISILLPALSRAREQAKSSVCLSNMRSLGLAVQTYLQLNNDRFPTVGLNHGGQSDFERTWVKLLAPEYIQRGGETMSNGSTTTLRNEVKDIRRCPTDKSVYFSQPRPSGGQNLWRQTSYASNYYLVVEEERIRTIGKEHAYNRLDRVPHPAETIYWVEMAEDGDYAVADHVHPEGWYAGDPRVRASEQVALDRHNGKANYAMVDGHSESLSFESTYKIDLNSSDIFSGVIAWFSNKYDPDVGR